MLRNPITRAIEVALRYYRRPLFISFWRGGAIVIGDLVFSVLPAGGTTEQDIRSRMSRLILFATLFCFAARSIYGNRFSHFRAAEALCENA